jgi:hypothetical protein
MSSPIALKELFKAGFEDFVIPSYEDAPYTTIQNRAKVTRSLKAIAGVERVMVRGVNLLQNEFGPNGERVWEADNKDSRIRFVGDWIGYSDSSSSRAMTPTASQGQTVEVTFYGTGLNWLTMSNGNTSTIVASIDGGAEGSSLLPASFSNILSTRNYSPNLVLSVASNLTLGWHTVKIRLATYSGINLHVYGFEILNQRTDLAVYPGAGISQGSFTGLSALTTSAFNAGISGTKGARVVKYIENGSLSQAVQEVDATAKYLTNTDHTNEEVVRRINFREFGANRADDFSTVSGAGGARAFTLDDGVTSLVTNDSSEGNSVGQPDYIGVNTTGGFLTLTFVGTGLDLVNTYTGTMPVSGTLQIDGTTIYTGTFTSFENTSVRVIKIASGLPYGTHTFRYAKTAAGSGLGIGDFIIYQPKKPSIPVGAFEVTDYNVMANFVANTVVGNDTISTGILRKSAFREFVYENTWSIDNTGLEFNFGGGELFTSALNGKVRYTFYGTGFDLRFLINANSSNNALVTLNGVNLTSANFPSASFATYGTGAGYNSTTAILDQLDATAQYGGGFIVSNLPLDSYTLVINNGTAGQNLRLNALDIITPIHINNPTLKVGSQSLKSETKYSPEKVQSNVGPDLSKAKAWAFLDGANSKILASYNISAVIFGSTPTYVYFEKPFKTDNYVVIGTTVGAFTFNQYDATTRKRNYVTISAWRFDTGYQLSGAYYFAVFGELFDE